MIKTDVGEIPMGAFDQHFSSVSCLPSSNFILNCIKSFSCKSFVGILLCIFCFFFNTIWNFFRVALDLIMVKLLKFRLC